MELYDTALTANPRGFAIEARRSEVGVPRHRDISGLNRFS